MALSDIATAIDCVELYVDGDRLFDPKNTLNSIQIILTTIHTHMQRVSNEALHYQDLLNMANRQVNNLMNDMLPVDYYNKVMQAINYGHSLGVVGFNNGIKTNILAGKMAGRFTLPNLFKNSAENTVNTPVLFIA
ncbi:7885_t:CDS:2 [Funneliformis geosporum]|nr:7885_t:CDS:2 [Funneliformis geosporum]